MAAPTDWLAEALDDVQSVRDFREKGHPKHACFHAQQAAEKALKGMLLKLGGRVPKIHNLSKLLERVRAADPGFPDHARAAVLLRKYYTLLRYPDVRPAGWAPPGAAETEEALRLAEAIVADARARIEAAPPTPPPESLGAPPEASLGPDPQDHAEDSPGFAPPA